MNKTNKKRNPAIALQLSLKFAKEYFKKLCEIKKTHTQDEIQESRELLIIWRSLWIALIVEIGRLFDTFDDGYKKVISFKKTSFFKNVEWKDKINSIHGEAIISKIIKNRKTFTAHWSEYDKGIVSVKEICDSNLGELLDKLDEPLNAFGIWFNNNRE